MFLQTITSNLLKTSPEDVQIGNHVFRQRRDCKANGEVKKCKAKAIQTDLVIFTHILAYSRIIQVYSEPCVTLWHIQNSSIFRIMTYSKPEAYSELLYIQNSGSFRIRDIFRILGYSKPWNIQNQIPTQNLVKHLQWSFSRNS